MSATYYRSQFPCEELWRLLRGAEFGTRREFAFELQGAPQGGCEKVMVRYQTFATLEAFHTYLQTHGVVAVHYGGIYNHPATREALDAAGRMSRCTKEMVFDFDVDDYDATNQRHCSCRGLPRLCAQCWPLMQTAMQVFRYRLVEKLGLKQVEFFFSGRRGVHCVVWDAVTTAFLATDRAAFVDFLKDPHDVKMTSDTYPRIDLAVSRDPRHLSKAPFSRHAKTGCVARRISPETPFVELGL